MKGKGKSKGSTKVKIGIESCTTLRVSELGATSSKKKGLNLSSGLLKKDGKQIHFKGLKTAQFELERMLHSITKRKNQLERRIQHLETQQTKIRKRSRSTDSVEKKSSEERPPKKAKEHTSKSHVSSTSLGLTKSKYFQDSHVEIPKPQKNDGPSRFWGYLEPYCSDITQENIRAIEDWISTSKSYAKYLEIPKLGKHFTSKWPMEDFLEEIKEGSKSVENPKGLFTNSSEDHAEAERVLKHGVNECSTEIDDQYAPMADRLVYSLVEENLMTAIDDTMGDACNDDIVQTTEPCITEPINQLNDYSLERKLCMDFQEAGLLDAEDVESEEPEDEVCRELKRLQNALIPVHEHNLLQMKKLLARAKAEMNKQEIKKKLHEVDAKVMEMYRLMAAARRNKTMNKKLEDQVKRLLRERKRILEKLENMTQSNANTLLN